MDLDTVAQSNMKVLSFPDQILPLAIEAILCESQSFSEVVLRAVVI